MLSMPSMPLGVRSCSSSAGDVGSAMDAADSGSLEGSGVGTMVVYDGD